MIDESSLRMRCQSCQEEYKEKDAGTCKECYEEASETEEELKREIEGLKAKVAFLRLCPPVDPQLPNANADLLLHGVSESIDAANPTLTAAVPAHRTVLKKLIWMAQLMASCVSDGKKIAELWLTEEAADKLGQTHPKFDKLITWTALEIYQYLWPLCFISRSPVFKAMLETEMEENKSGMIKIYDVSYEVLRSFVKYLYTAEALLDEQMACDLLVLAEKYQVKHLKSFCEKFMTSKVNNENAIASFAFAHQHHAKQLIEASLSSILENMSTLTEREDYKELLDRDPRLVVEIYEAYITKQANTAER